MRLCPQIRPALRYLSLKDCADIFTTVIPVSPAPILCTTAELPSPRPCQGRRQTPMQCSCPGGNWPLAPASAVFLRTLHHEGPRSSKSQTSANPGLVALHPSKASRVFSSRPSASRTSLAKQSGMTILALTMPCGEINYQYRLAFRRHSI